MVEFAVCLPFLILLLGALVDFGFAFHQQVRMWQVVRVGADLLHGAGRIPGPDDLVRIREAVAFAGREIGLEPGDVRIEVPRSHPGFLEIAVRLPAPRVSPVAWTMGRGDLAVSLTVPVEVSP